MDFKPQPLLSYHGLVYWFVQLIDLVWKEKENSWAQSDPVSKLLKGKA